MGTKAEHDVELRIDYWQGLQLQFCRSCALLVALVDRYPRERESLNDRGLASGSTGWFDEGWDVCGGGHGGSRDNFFG
jgi:hypothetical protein